ncbi:uncharacterized protein LOC119671102 [Teleopsis dalmanni]|uniref:uncharacterized protein LOC119671102 n=1 Tax=Teleopsis dalmanni TaxID=139649 RepID=UPI0018CF2592|nr:uncharacterized protein LOC119671102 [Teleopsis dalmanni]
MDKIYWSHENLAILINLWKNNPNLYDLNHKDYLNRNRREKSFCAINMELKKRMPYLDMEDLRKKMQNLRTQYTREHRLVQRSIRTESSTPYVPRLWYFKRLSFLEYHLRSADSNIADDIDRDIFSEFVDVNASSTEHLPKLKSEHESYYSEKRKAIQIETQHLQTHLDQLKDHICETNKSKFEWVGQQVVYYMRKLNDPILQEETSCQIQLALKDFITKDQELTKQKEKVYNISPEHSWDAKSSERCETPISIDDSLGEYFLESDELVE